MKFIILPISILLNFNCLIQGQLNNQEKSSFQSFLDLFPEKEFPLLTREYSTDMYFYYNEDKYSLIPDSLILKFICFGDSSKLNYYYYYPPMEEGLEPQEGTVKIEYYAIAKIITENVILIIYPYDSEEDYFIYLNSYTKDGQFIDSLRINDYYSADYYATMRLKTSYIKTDEIITFDYISIGNENLKDKEGKQYLTKSIVTTYKIEEDGHFTFLKADSSYLHTSYLKFQILEGPLQNDDPLQFYRPDLPKYLD